MIWEPGISLLQWRGELTFCCVCVALSLPTAVLPYQTFIVFLSPLIFDELPSCSVICRGALASVCIFPSQEQ